MLDTLVITLQVFSTAGLLYGLWVTFWNWREIEGGSNFDPVWYHAGSRASDEK